MSKKCTYCVSYKCNFTVRTKGGSINTFKVDSVVEYKPVVGVRCTIATNAGSAAIYSFNGGHNMWDVADEGSIQTAFSSTDLPKEVKKNLKKLPYSRNWRSVRDGEQTFAEFDSGSTMYSYVVTTYSPDNRKQDQKEEAQRFARHMSILTHGWTHLHEKLRSQTNDVDAVFTQIRNHAGMRSAMASAMLTPQAQGQLDSIISRATEPVGGIYNVLRAHGYEAADDN